MQMMTVQETESAINELNQLLSVNNVSMQNNKRIHKLLQSIQVFGVATNVKINPAYLSRLY